MGFRTWPQAVKRRNEQALRRVTLKTPTGSVVRKEFPNAAETKKWLQCYRDRERDNGDVEVLAIELVFR